MKDVTDLAPGDRVCVVGRGMDSPIHRHLIVERVTKTMIITNDDHRYRRENHVAGSIPYSPYGGTSLYTTCQKKGR